jgi:hypothetical protein
MLLGPPCASFTKDKLRPHPRRKAFARSSTYDVLGGGGGARGVTRQSFLHILYRAHYGEPVGWKGSQGKVEGGEKAKQVKAGITLPCVPALLAVMFVQDKSSVFNLQAPPMSSNAVTRHRTPSSLTPEFRARESVSSSGKRPFLKLPPRQATP